MCVMKKPFCPSTLFFQNMPMKMEEPSCIAKCDSAPDFAKWTWRISANLGSGVIFSTSSGGEVCCEARAADNFV